MHPDLAVSSVRSQLVPFTHDIDRADEPLWAEVFSPERLEQHGESLARAQTVGDRPVRWLALTRRNIDNARALLDSYEAISASVKRKRLITPAADWLINNFHVVEDQVRDIRTLLSRRFYGRLPRLDSGHLAGLPRVYGIAWAFVAHTDSRFDPDLLLRLVQAYQREQPLLLAELWALPILLRIVMIENQRRLAERIVLSMRGREAADHYADALLGLTIAGDELQLRAADESALLESRASSVQLVVRLRHRDGKAAAALKTLSDRLASEGTSAEEIVQLEIARQAAADLSVRNLITSMRLMSAFDWRDFVESASLVHQELSENPVFPGADFITRDRYRAAVEQLARHAPSSEIEIARAAVAHATLARSQGGDERLCDVGHYLIGAGRPAFERELSFKPRLGQYLLRRYVRAALPAYLATIAVFTFGILAILLTESAAWGASREILWLLGVIAVFPVADIAAALTNRLVTDMVPPRHLPRMSLKEGITADARTFVVIPTILVDQRSIIDQAQMLEAHYLSNGAVADEIYFALLTDWIDSDSAHRNGDDLLHDLAAAALAELNERHGPAPDGSPRFYLFHRRRQWNEKQDCWMGWERKRGKLHEFNRLLRGATDTNFMPHHGVLVSPPPGVRFVVTLDGDTVMPMHTVGDLVGTLLHPLNRPRFDPRTQCVIEGYGILQPRVTPMLPTRRRSTLFQWMFSGRCGLDPYTFQVSDVSQDLFGHGTFTGKGLYEVDTIERALAGRVPENAILSHDLFEGGFARCGFVSDVELFEEFPSHVEVAAARNHRWARGDWQLLPWIFGLRGRDLSAVTRWKMADNLRRPLVPIALLALLVMSWVSPSIPRWPWIILALLVFAVPTVLPVIDRLLPRPRTDRIIWLRLLRSDFIMACGRVTLQLLLLPYHALLMLDAVLRTLFRLGRGWRLLEWQTAAQVQANVDLSLGGFVHGMRASVGLAIAIALTVLAANPAALAFSLPLAGLWLVAPWLAWRASAIPLEEPVQPLLPSEAREFRLIARRTWQFFATLVTASEHWLPPDNLQEDLPPVIAKRTSPTNIGLYLLAIVAARDFGWIGLFACCERIEATLGTLKALPRHRGHFLNWVETTTLRTLEPRYVSTVDSGNLAACLLTLEVAMSDAVERPMRSSMLLAGLADACELLSGALAVADDARRTAGVEVEQLHEVLAVVRGLLGEPPATAAQWWHRLQALDAAITDMRDIAATLAAESGGALDEVLVWIDSVTLAIAEFRSDLDILAPWAAVFARHAPPDSEPAAQARWNALQARFPIDLPMAQISPRFEEAVPVLDAMREECGAGAIDALQEAFQRSREARAALVERLDVLKRTARCFFDEMDFRFLYDPTRKLFSIGFQVDSGRLDPGYYDLLASEARLASFIAIAKHEVPPAHWFQLGRPMISLGNDVALASWSGSMFEYLMPSLLLRLPFGSLLDRTCRAMVRRQIRYGLQRRVPWGVSESAFNKRDVHRTYQYSNFGIPGLGLKRGLGEDLVIAPYATALAAMVEPRAAAENFARLASLGALGRFGFYEALDFTRTRVPEEGVVAIVRAYMAHHQGMTLVALANALLAETIRERFHRVPIVRATQLLLQETAQRDIASTPLRADQVELVLVGEAVSTPERSVHSPHLSYPSTQLLSNGRYAVMVSAAGSGYSLWRDIAVNRWREDPTCDRWGSYLYLRDIARGKVWSAGYQPTCVEPDAYDVEFTEDRARIMRTDSGIESTLDIIVSAEDDAEIRRLTLKNAGKQTREIEVTSYAEMVLAPAAADIAHPAFSNLFVRTEYVPEVSGLLIARRPRGASEKPLFAAHVVAREGTGGIEYETDRARFLGRGRTVHAPMAVMGGRPLSNTVGPVLDPVASLRVRLTVRAGATVHVDFATMIAPSREDALTMADKYHDPQAFERASTLAWTHAQVQLHYLGIDHDEAHLFQQLANRLIYCDSSLRPASDVLQGNRLPVSRLWHLGISGDRPIMLAEIDDADDRGMVRQLLTAHEYWSTKRLAVDLVILNATSVTYAPGLQGRLEGMVSEAQARVGSDGPPGRGDIFVVRGHALDAEERNLLYSVARATVSSAHGNLSEQVMRTRRRAAPPTPAVDAGADRRPDAVPLALPQLRYFNGLGGFSADGRQYTIVLNRGQQTPTPWINVIANEGFGFQVSESGTGYTWAGNSRENQLTPWSNDSISAPPGEAFYLRDLDRNVLWTPTALPIRNDAGTYIANFGRGYARFEHHANDIRSQLTQFVPIADPVKISHLLLVNDGTSVKRLSVTAYVEWVLGSVRMVNTPLITTSIHPGTGAVLARNPRNREFGERVAFAAWDQAAETLTCDRGEFIGRNGRLDAPDGLLDGRVLSGVSGAGLDPCVALQRAVTLLPGQSLSLHFILGEAENIDVAIDLVARYQSGEPTAWLEESTRGWDKLLDCVEVETPDQPTNILLNGWLVYQTVSCRLYARAGFYQAGGAYGFRDQLQDSMALIPALPALARNQILKACAHQFPEGDVQHWWHPPSGRGVRTRSADDRLWLPYALAHYLQATGDSALLEAAVAFIDGPAVPAESEDLYFEPSITPQTASVYEHCVRALDASLGLGPHGLPLMEGGDWNDGMNRVGIGGRGESVWLGWFLCDLLRSFVQIAQGRGDTERGERWARLAIELKSALEQHAWDGAWYRRAYFDDGTPLGSADNAECRIDSIAQSWAVISGVADPGRARRAMESVYQYLVKPGDDMLLLLTPPFDRSVPNPGYISRYLPGVRENGGQYTHAAAWCVVACALLGDGDRAGELFSMLNPINHAATRAGAHRYKVEPYVVAADIYSEPPHIGRGGWTWYTGAAGWMYRAGIECLLGFRLRGDHFVIDPCVPRAWKGFSLRYRRGATRYLVRVDNPHGVSRGIAKLELDGRNLEPPRVPVVDDGATHDVHVVMGTSSDDVGPPSFH
jgi:cyclic beta-1,2-glucan synthetase